MNIIFSKRGVMKKITIKKNSCVLGKMNVEIKNDMNTNKIGMGGKRFCISFHIFVNIFAVVITYFSA